MAEGGVIPRTVKELRARLAARWSRVRDVFHTWDEDHSGTVSRAEWCRALPAMGLGEVSYADSAELFDFFDKDGSGELDYRELHTVLRQGASVELRESLKKGATDFERAVRQQKALRKQARKEAGSNVINGAKLSGGGSSEAVVEQLRAALAANLMRVIDLFREWDDDGSGAIDHREFARALAVLGLKASAQERQALFESLDRDGSGTLEYRELHAQLRPRPGAHRERDAAAGSRRGALRRARTLTDRVRAAHQDGVAGRTERAADLIPLSLPALGKFGASQTFGVAASDVPAASPDRFGDAVVAPLTAVGGRPLPPVPVLPTTAPARHRRVGKRRALRRARGPQDYYDDGRAPAPSSLPPPPGGALPPTTFLPPVHVVANRGFKWNWQA